MSYLCYYGSIRKEKIMLEKICIFANLSIPYVYEEGFTTLEILKNLIKHTNEIIDEVNKIPAFELKVNNELAKLNEKLVTDITNLKQEILDLFPVEFEKELQKAINNNKFDVLLNPLKSDIEALQTKVNLIESDVTLLKNKVTSLETRTETLETKTETLENTTNEINQNLATKIDDAPRDNNTYGRNNNNWVCFILYIFWSWKLNISTNSWAYGRKGLDFCSIWILINLHRSSYTRHCFSGYGRRNYRKIYK